MIHKTLLHYTPLKVRMRTRNSPHYTAVTFARKVIYSTTTSPFRSTQQTIRTVPLSRVNGLVYACYI